MDKTLVVGRIVHYVLNGGKGDGEHRPAVIVRVWNQVPGTVNLQVITDDSNDGLQAIEWRTSVIPGAADEKARYHWPDACSAKEG